jgi:hypothetical protein
LTSPGSSANFNCRRCTCRLKILRLFLILALGVWLLPQNGLARDNQPGTIQGSLSYPSEFIPPDLVICAENLAAGQRLCTDKHLKGKQFQYRVGYRLALPPGDYHVYAYLPDPARYGADFSRDYRAYYSEFVKCGMRDDCPLPKPVVVQVESGKNLIKIDPQDWYH